MSFRYTFFLPENGQIAADVNDKAEQIRIDAALYKKYLHVPTNEYDLYISFDQIKCVTAQKIESTSILKNGEPEKFEPAPE